MKQQDCQTKNGTDKGNYTVAFQEHLFSSNSLNAFTSHFTVFMILLRAVGIKKKLANTSMKIITWHYGNHVKMHFKRFPMINILLLYKLLQVKDLKLYATWTQTFYQLKCESEVFSFHCYWMEAVFSEFFFLSDTCAQVSGMLVILLW